MGVPQASASNSSYNMNCRKNMACMRKQHAHENEATPSNAKMNVQDAM
jgi:hypothetical protein